MKKLILLLALMSVAVFTACSSDDEEENLGHDNALVGTWKEDTNHTFEVFNKQFNADGSGFHWGTDNGVIDSYGKTKITWRTKGNSLYITFPKDGEVKYTYEVEGDKLTTVYEDEIIVYKRQAK